MENIRMFDGRTPTSATDRGHEVPPEQPAPDREPVPTVTELTARLDALEREYRQWRAVARGTVDVHGTVPGSGTMRRAGKVFAMQPDIGHRMTYEEQ